MSDDTRSGSISWPPNLFSKQLEPIVGGHAVFHPRDSEDDGGNIGDCGYFARGRFCKLFNVYENPGENLPVLPPPRTFTNEVRNAGAFKSSRLSSVSFGGCASIPASAAPISVDVSANVSATDETFAFLACAGQYRVDEDLSRPDVKELKRYLARNHAALKQLGAGNVCIVRSTMKASGWISAVAQRTSREGSASVSVGVTGIAQLGIGASWSVTSAGPEGHGAPLEYHPSVGPHVEWDARSLPKYSVVLTVVVRRTRDKITSPFRVLTAAATKSFDAGFQHSAESTAVSGPSGSSSGRVTQADVPMPSDSMRTYLPTSSPESSFDLTDDESSQSGSSVSYTGEGEQSSLLDDILDEFLAVNPQIDAVVGDTTLISLYYESQNSHPAVGCLSFEWETEYDAGEVVAYLDKISHIPTQEESRGKQPLFASAFWDMEGPIMVSRGPDNGLDFSEQASQTGSTSSPDHHRAPSAWEALELRDCGMHALLQQDQENHKMMLTPMSPDTSTPASQVGPDGKARPRVSEACQRCRAQKVRCDALKPCRNCTRLSVECKYGSVPNRRAMKKKVPEDPSAPSQPATKKKRRNTEGDVAVTTEPELLSGLAVMLSPADTAGLSLALRPVRSGYVTPPVEMDRPQNRVSRYQHAGSQYDLDLD